MLSCNAVFITKSSIYQKKDSVTLKFGEAVGRITSSQLKLEKLKDEALAIQRSEFKNGVSVLMVYLTLL